ncbi:MAG TPA: hypothetical protein DCW90_04410 [Lachnospiraceae bacterium]|nr:hypothetical protein [Lachnospiraceae bacterium]
MQTNLKKIIHSTYSDNLEIINKINEQPTVYDLGKVIERLEEYFFEKYCIEGNTKIEEIVKGDGWLRNHDNEIINKFTERIKEELEDNAIYNMNAINTIVWQLKEEVTE